MKEFIADECAKYFGNAIRKYSNRGQVALNFRLIGDEPHYFLCVDGVVAEELSIKDILNYKIIDLKQYSLILPPQIQAILQDFEVQYQHAVDVIVMLDDDEDVRYFMYLSDAVEPTYVKEFNIVDVLKI